VMLARFREKAATAGSDNVEVVQAGFLTYEHSGTPADAVYSRLALHHLPDFWKSLALTRIAGMLRTGGVFRLSDVVYSFSPEEADERIESWIANTMSADVEGGWTRAELAEHIRRELHVHLAARADDRAGRLRDRRRRVQPGPGTRRVRL